MNINLRTSALIAAGIVSAGSAAFAEEANLSPVQTALSSTTISGYVSASALIDVAGNDVGPRLPGRSFDGADKANKINLDVVKLTIEKPLDEGDWSAGYKVDLLFGPDANTFGTSSVLGENNSDFGVKQAYVTLQTPVGNDLTAKVGVFDTIIGYEVFESGNNPNYSRSYGYFIEPTQHTGVLLSYALTDWLSLNAGAANAWNARINAPGADDGEARTLGIQTYMGSVAITVPDSAGFLSGTSVYGGIVHGLGSVELADGDPRTSYYAGVTVPTPIENLGVGLSYDYRTTERARAGMDNASEYATAIAGYLSYQVSQQVKLSARGEYATGSAGTWGALTAGGPEGEEFLGVTGTVDIGLWANVLTRLEFRWDNDLSGNQAFGGSKYPGDADNNAYMATLNFLYKF